MSTDTEHSEERTKLSRRGWPITEVKNNLTDIVDELEDEPVVINVQGDPRAAIIRIDLLLEMVAKAEAYDLMKIADEAEKGKKLTLSELRTFFDQRSAERQAARKAEGRAA